MQAYSATGTAVAVWGCGRAACAADLGGARTGAVPRYRAERPLLYSIYEFLFPEISLCDETTLALLGDDETLRRSVTNLRRTGSRIFNV